MFLVKRNVVSALSGLSLAPESYKFRLFMDNRSRLIEVLVRGVHLALGRGVAAKIYVKPVEER